MPSKNVALTNRALAGNSLKERKKSSEHTGSKVFSSPAEQRKTLLSHLKQHLRKDVFEFRSIQDFAAIYAEYAKRLRALGTSASQGNAPPVGTTITFGH